MNSFTTISYNTSKYNESKEFAKSFREEKAEQEDIDSRRCNVILYRIPESREVIAERETRKM